MAALSRAPRHDLGVRESFGHGVLDCVDSCHRAFDRGRRFGGGNCVGCCRSVGSYDGEELLKWGSEEQ